VLKYVDVFIGVALVMLGLSLIITVITQIISFAANFRGRQLRNGLAELLGTLAPDELGANASDIATRLLHHPLIVDGLGVKRLAPAISRVDLVNLLKNPTLLQLKDTKIGATVATKLATLSDEVDLWFDATMSRVANRFSLQTRVITVIAGSLMAFALQLDAFGLVKRLYADTDLRASLVGATSTMLGNAQEVLSPPTIYRDTALALSADSKNGLPPPPATLASRDEAEAWIRKSKGNDVSGAAALVTAYEDLLGKSLQEKIPGLVNKAVAIKGDLDRVENLRLIPDHSPFDFESVWVLLGVLTSAALLSLGAPFWFNMLKTASNLRPAIAAYVENRKTPDAPAPQPALVTSAIVPAPARPTTPTSPASA
jgi:hypothetical protein